MAEGHCRSKASLRRGRTNYRKLGRPNHWPFTWRSWGFTRGKHTREHISPGRTAPGQVYFYFVVFGRKHGRRGGIKPVAVSWRVASRGGILIPYLSVMAVRRFFGGGFLAALMGGVILWGWKMFPFLNWPGVTVSQRQRPAD